MWFSGLRDQVNHKPRFSLGFIAESWVVCVLFTFFKESKEEERQKEESMGGGGGGGKGVLSW